MNSNENTPLLGHPEDGIDEHERLILVQATAEIKKSGNDDVDYLEELPEWTKKEILITVLSVVAVSLSTVGLCFLPIELFLYDTFNLLGIIIPLWSAFQEQKVTEVIAIKKLMVKFDAMMQSFIAENETMQNVIQKMDATIGKLDEYKTALTHIHESEKMTLHELEADTEERKSIADLNKTNLVTGIINNVVDVLLKVDDDQNMVLSEKEIDSIIKALEGMNNVDINDAIIHKKIKEYGNDLNGIMRLINDLYDEDLDFDITQVITR